MSILITNIGELVTNEAAVDRDGGALGIVRDAAVLVDDGRIAWVGAATHASERIARNDERQDRREAEEHRVLWDAVVEVVDAAGRAVIPGFVDSHTHLVFGGDRAQEFAARMAGRRYEAGGIRSTVAATRAATDDELRIRLAGFVDELHAQGTTTFEVKSGYGLSVADEERLVRLAREVTDEVTFLGAHVVPAEFADADAAADADTAPGASPDTTRAPGTTAATRAPSTTAATRAPSTTAATRAPSTTAAETRTTGADAYVDLVVGDMLAACAPHARWIDAFCERGAFTPEQSRRVLEAGAAAGLGVRVHGNQLGEGEGVRLAVELGAASVDHCTYLSDADVAALAASDTVATLLPGVEFSTRQPYPDARRLIDAGVTVALASDCNPGSSFTSSMPFCIAVAVRDMGMTPAEAVWASTAGGALALRRSDVGAIRAGARADLVLLDAPSHVHLAYRPGVPLVAQVWKDGAVVG